VIYSEHSAGLPWPNRPRRGGRAAECGGLLNHPVLFVLTPIHLFSMIQTALICTELPHLQVIVHQECTKTSASDTCGKSGLGGRPHGKVHFGRFYLNAAFDRYGDLEQARQHIAVYDPTIKDDLLALSKICQVESCRKPDYHQTPFFAEEFAEKRARALVGYSESLSGALAAAADPTKCPVADKCLKDNDFDVEEFPLDDKGTHALSWVDSFVLDKKCKDQCAKDAVAFIQFMTQDDTYLVALLPKGGRPTYLLPAKASLYSNAELLRAAHLYPKLRKIIEQAAVPSALSLNEQLRNVGRQLDSDLPQQ
jgi:hypothetical protein